MEDKRKRVILHVLKHGKQGKPNHVWSVFARWMKHNHTSWSRRGGNHLAKILAKKCSGKLYEVTGKLKRPVFEEEKVEVLKAVTITRKSNRHIISVFLISLHFQTLLSYMQQIR